MPVTHEPHGRLAMRALSLVVAGAAAVSPLQTAVSQTEEFVPGEPGSCAAAARTLAAGTVRALEFDVLAECRESGPQALADVWSRSNFLSATDVASLMRASLSLRDGRLYRALLTVVGNPRKSTALRLSALQVLASYYSGELTASQRWLTAARVGEDIPRTTLHFDSLTAVPLPASRLSEVATLLARLALEDPDSTFRQAALRLAQGIAWLHPEQVPVARSAVRLVTGCGSRVDIETTLAIVVALRMRVLGTSYDYTFTPKRWIAGAPDRILMSPPVGTVVVSYGSGQELARLSERNGPCKPGEVRLP